MAVPEQSSIRNRLLRAMSPEDYALLTPYMELVKADKGTTLFKQDEPIESVWFMESGVGSIITVSPEGLQAENGLFGREGFAPVGVVLGADRAPHLGMIQIGGDFMVRIPAARLTEACERSVSLRTLLLRYAQTLSVQTAYTALTNAVHPIDERLARWILMCDDRMDGELALTHEFMSVMLAVRRPTVTTSLHVLEGNGFICADRGSIVVRNRAALEEFAGDSYGAPEREYERLIGPLR